ncbi:MAG: hypothetical protein HY582_00390 [Candidatus Omnitrophica bacterium]|nr:hypothetical protein [Candidatus Omnitrophota bacterium]
MSKALLKQIEKRVSEGSAFLMIGGWSSYTGRDGNYKGSVIEKILPVTCLAKDDRRHLASGAAFRVRVFHPILKGLSLKPSPVIIGYNEVQPKKDSKVILELEESASRKRKPLLILGNYGAGKVAAWTTDVAPHWCGGLVDWGDRRLRISVARGIQIEVGNHYVQFFSQLICWLSNPSPISSPLRGED